MDDIVNELVDIEYRVMKFAEKLNTIGYAKVERNNVLYFVHPDYTDDFEKFNYDHTTPVKYKVQTEANFLGWLESVPEGAVIPNPFYID